MQKKARPLYRWQWLVLILLFLALGWVSEYVVQQENQRQQDQQMREVVAVAGQLRALLESEINTPLSLSFGVSAHIQALSGQVSPQEFALLLPNLVRQGKHVRNIAVAPGNRITHVYPVAGNEKVLGLFYPDLTAQWPEIATAIQTRTSQLYGPIELAQGGVGFIHRIPVFLLNDDYWGIVSTVLDIDSIWQFLSGQARQHEVAVALRRVGPRQTSEMLLGEASLFEKNPHVLDLNILHARWQLAVQPLVAPTLLQSWPIRLLCWALGLVLWLLMLVIFIANRRWAETALEYQQSESYSRAVLDNIAEAIVVVSDTGAVDRVNQAALRLFGYPHAEIIGLHYQALFESAVPLLGANSHLELTAKRQQGDTFIVEFDQTRLEEPNQGLVVLLIRDITERKKIAQLKDEFVATVSHELRTPLTAINGALGLLSGGALGAMPMAQQKLLDIAQQNGQQLALLINDILDIEKLAAGKMQLFIRPVSVVNLLEQARNRHLPLAEHSQVRLLIGTDLSEACQVLVDEQRIQQVFANLLANAIRFSGPQSQVLLEARIIEDKVRISVSDQGPGVPADFVGRLFQKFSQADSSSTRRLNGTGLGLAICKELVERMGGQIGYQPGLEGGSCFYFDVLMPSVEL